jgi:hypothetical protein
MTQDLITQLETAKRPRLLMRAARHGRHLYDRNRDLARIIPQQGSIAQCDIVKSLIMIEDAHEKKRRQNDAAYFVTDHVECLSALLAESVLLLQRAEQTA